MPQVTAIGHAIVDVLVDCRDADVEALGLRKGTMTLVDADTSRRLYASVNPAARASGGSAANTAACLASLGASVDFVGKVAGDELGEVFTEDIRAAGVGFAVTAGDGGHTGRCVVLVTPDAEKTMCTDLGIGATLTGADVAAEGVESSQVTYLEGYLVADGTASAVEAAVTAARRAGGTVALSASDPAWVEFRRSALVDLLPRTDILFANEAEALGLSGRGTAADAAAWLLDALAPGHPSVVVTLGGDGCLIAGPEGRVRLPAEPLARAVDTTGAGDSFAAGYLYGTVNGLGAETSGRIGALVAAEVVSHLGARPQADLRRLAVSAGLIAP